MEENNELMTIEENNELEEYEESSCNGGLLNLAIGIGIGATANEIVKLLDTSDDYYIFSFDFYIDKYKL